MSYAVTLAILSGVDIFGRVGRKAGVGLHLQNKTIHKTFKGPACKI